LDVILEREDAETKVTLRELKTQEKEPQTLRKPKKKVWFLGRIKLTRTEEKPGKETIMLSKAPGKNKFWSLGKEKKPWEKHFLKKGGKRTWEEIEMGKAKSGGLVSHLMRVRESNTQGETKKRNEKGDGGGTKHNSVRGTAQEEITTITRKANDI